MTNREISIKEHLKSFQEFHGSFYSFLRNFLITGNFPPDDFLKSECFPFDLSETLEKEAKKEKEEPAPSDEKLNDRQIRYKILLKNIIKTFCIKPVAKFLTDCHSLSPEFEKKKKEGNNNDKDLPFRGIVFLHSREFGEGKKIDIPFGVWEHEQETKVTNKVFNLRHSVSHILGETMWRFFEPGKVKIPCIYFSKDTVPNEYNYSVCIPLNKNKIDDALRDDIKNLSVEKAQWYDELYDRLEKEEVFQGSIRNIIDDAKNKFKSWLPNTLMFLIEGIRAEYNKDEIERLLANPIRQAIISKASNIFYIPDIHRSIITGGLVCELSLKKGEQKAKILSDELKDIRSDLQWIFSNYVFAPISSCETEFGSGIEFTYSQKFFTGNESKTGKEVFEDFKNDLYKKLNNNQLTKTLEPLRYFFEAVSEERGQYVRGYEDISKKAFITICRLWNALEVYKIAGGKKIENGDLEKIETDVKNFKNISGNVDAIQLLWVALDFEDMLKNVPSYREHFIHSFHVFCLGLWILSHTKFSYHQHLKNENFLGQWFLTALWHDVSYAMQKLAEISNILIKELVRCGYERKKKGLLVPISPSWGHLLLAKDFYKLLVGHKHFQKILRETLTGTAPAIIKDLPNIILETALDNAEHGILSGLILYHQLRDVKGKNQVKPKNILPVIVAIMLHGCYGWEWKDENGEEINGAEKLKIDVKNTPIAHLLMLCDTFVHSGREFYDEKTGSATQQEIRFKGITSESVDSQNIRIVLEYSNIDNGKTLEQIKIYYFDPPREVLNEKDTGSVSNIIICTIKNKDDPNATLRDSINFTFA